MSISPSLPLSGKVALVTGSSRGIGAAIAKRLAKDGAAVIVHYSSSKDKAEEVAGEIRKAGGRADVAGADLSVHEGPAKLISQLDGLFGGEFAGRLDILVNNSGTGKFSPLLDATEQDFDSLYTLNVRSVFLLSKEAAKRATPQGWGRIINIGSTLGESVPLPGISIYSSTKFAVNGLTRGWSRDLGTTGVTVNNVQPGPITTDLNPGDGPRAELIKTMTSLGRFGTVEEGYLVGDWIRESSDSGKLYLFSSSCICFCFCFSTMHCLSSSCWALPHKLESLSLISPPHQNAAIAAASFRPLGFSANLSVNIFSKGLENMRPVKCPPRQSIVCEATAPGKKVDSAAKRARQAEKRRLYNKAKKSEVKTRMKKVLVELEQLRKKSNAEPAEVLSIEKLIAEAYSSIDKAVKTGTLHRNTGARRKSRLARNKKAVEIHHGWYTPAPVTAPDADNNTAPAPVLSA